MVFVYYRGEPGEQQYLGKPTDRSNMLIEAKLVESNAVISEAMFLCLTPNDKPAFVALCGLTPSLA